MPYKRTGECNQCGECCGFPRSTDGGQNNPWPEDWPDNLEGFSQEEKERLHPVFRLTNRFYTPCAFLSSKLADGRVPCLLYGTKDHDVWEKCSIVPPPTFETETQVEIWRINCPSCSFVYEEE